MRFESQDLQTIHKDLEKISKLLELFVAIQMYSQGASQEKIASVLNISKTTANDYLKGVNKGKWTLPKPCLGN